MKFLPIKRKKELELVTLKQRYDCPFYGFHAAREMLIDSEGNQCALITKRYSPCQMGIRDQIPSWSECPFNTEESRRAISEYSGSFRVFPEELFPKGKESWEGISLTEWLAYVRSPEAP